MARIRTIKPEFFKDEKVTSLPMAGRLLFIGLWNLSDDHGYLWYDPFFIKCELFPVDEVDVRGLLDLLFSKSLIKRCATTKGKDAIYIPSFLDHQTISNPAKQKISLLVSEILCSPLEESVGLSPEGKGREGKGKETEGREGKGKEESPTAQEPPEADSPPTPDQAEEVLKAWNSTEGILKADKLTPKRRTAIHARFRESYFRSNWTTGISLVGSSAFCQGDNDRGWKASLDWFLKPETLVKIIEGKYANASRAGPAGGVDLFGGLREFVKNGG